MPKSFDNCYKAGGSVRTERIGSTHYRKVCYLKGKKYYGHVEKRKSK